MAIHEAGHQVIAEWLGLQVTSTTATATHGLTNWTADFSAAAAALPPDLDDQRVLVGTAVSLLHAGVVAERLAAGLPLDCAIYYPDQVDFQAAETMLKPTFGAMSSAAHGYAQRVAAHVLHGRWDRVREVAQVLSSMANGVGQNAHNRGSRFLNTVLFTVLSETTIAKPA